MTVNGSPAQGAWYFQKSAVYQGYPVEAHYRLQDYWPAHASIHLDLPVQGKSAGAGLAFDNSLTLDMSTGPANISKIDGASERMVVTSDGQQVFSFPVSLGKASTPTFGGVKVLMAKNRVEHMVSNTPGNVYDLTVPWSVRITNSGEFIHAASWNGGNIGQRSTSHGCTSSSTSPRSATWRSTPTPAARRCRAGTGTATGTCPGAAGRAVAWYRPADPVPDATSGARTRTRTDGPGRQLVLRWPLVLGCRRVGREGELRNQVPGQRRYRAADGLGHAG